MPSITPEYGSFNNFNIVFVAQYYKSTNQNLINGSNDITFDLTQPWNNTGGYITNTNGTPNFTVVIPGLYQLEFCATINANSATWNTGTNKVVSIDITRIGIPEVVALGQTANTSSLTNYIQSVTSSFYLEAGDIINCRVNCNYASNTPNVAGVTNTFDLNTFFTWKFIK